MQYFPPLAVGIPKMKSIRYPPDKIENQYLELYSPIDVDLIGYSGDNDAIDESMRV